MPISQRPVRRGIAALLGAALLAAISLAAGSPARAQTPTPFPECGGGTTQECVVAFTVDGAAPPAGVTLSVVKQSATVLDIQVLQSGAAQNGIELSPALTPESEIHVELNVGALDPVMLLFTGNVESFTPTIDSGAGNTVAFDVMPTASSWRTTGCSADACGDKTTKADADLTAVAVGRLVTGAFTPASVVEDMRGTWVATDAQAIATPTFDAATDTFTVRFAAAHLKADSTTNDDGFFEVFLRDAALQNHFAAANPAMLTSESFVTTRTSSGDLTAEVTDTVTRVTGGIEVAVPVFTYSNPRFDISRATTSAGRPATVDIASSASGNGYWLVDATGGVWPFGDAGAFGSLAGVALNQPIVGMAPTASGNGYYLVATDGGVFTFGDAVFFGSTGNIRLNQPIVGMDVTPSGNGYYLVASDGGIFTFGDAVFRGSMGAVRLNQPVVGMDVTPSGNGYYLVASDGGIFTFGDAVFRGSMGAVRLNQPVVGMETTGDGAGYWLVASDGGIFTFGNATFHGSLGSLPLVQPVVGMVATSAGDGYRLAARDGGLFALGAATYLGGRAL